MRRCAISQLPMPAQAAAWRHLCRPAREPATAAVQHTIGDAHVLLRTLARRSAMKARNRTTRLPTATTTRSKLVLGKRMEDHLRLAVCYWHTFVWPGGDMFGAGTFERPWQQRRRCAGTGACSRPMPRSNSVREARHAVTTPSTTPTSRPKATSLKELQRELLRRSSDYLATQAARHAASSCCGARPTCSRIRAMRRARPPTPIRTSSRSPRRRCAHALDATQRLGGENYVLWGGREGYDTLLNTDLEREREQLGRFLHMVVEHKHKIGFKGTLLIEPKPQEPTKHQYDYDVATVHGFLQQLRADRRKSSVNIEANHATLAGHSFRARDRDGACARHLRHDRRESRRSAERLGHRPVPEQRRGTDAGASTRFSGTAASRRAASTSTRRCAARASIRKICSTAISARSTSRARARTRGRAGRKRPARERSRQQRYAGWDAEFGRKVLAGGYSLDSLAADALRARSQPAARERAAGAAGEHRQPGDL